jgi:uncharacterized protein (DUF1778 family)
MPRLSIDISPEDHQRLKAMAALKGESLKDFVLRRTLADVPSLVSEMSEAEAIAALRAALEPRLESARRGERSRKTPDEIRQHARQQAGL